MAKLNLSENARTVLKRRYLIKDEDGKVVESPDEMFRRVAKYLASADKLYGADEKGMDETEKKFYEMMSALEFMPNSPTLMNAGKELAQLSACFVLPIEDSMESIFETIKSTAMIHKSGGGTGFSFSRLRPKKSMVKTTGGVASGPVSFMKVFDSATEAVKQGGSRRGANMGILRVDHPDIMEFIQCKESDRAITNFNISVSITDDFMEKVLADKKYDLLNPSTKKTVGSLQAREVFDLIVKMAWKNGEPGIIFIDRMNKFNPTPGLGEYESTNPCGEQVLLPYESCNLGSINLSQMVKKGRDKCAVDWQKLETTINNAVHFLDNVIDMNKFPLKIIEDNTKRTRKIGLGVMGWGTMLVQLDIPYNSDEAIALAEKVMEFIQKKSVEKSKELARLKGTFPAFKESIYDASKPKVKLRNATTTTIAPTGTISIIAGPCTSGIEPIFAISYYRNVMDNDKLVEVDSVFEKVAKERGFYSRELMEKIAQRSSIQDIDEIPEEVRRIFVTSHDVSADWHTKMQAAFQKYTHNAVSKTVNFPQNASIEDVRGVYLLAYKSGCKGVTIYRDKSRDEQVLNIAKSIKGDKGMKSAQQTLKGNVGNIAPKPRPRILHGTTTKITTGCGNLYVTINEDEANSVFEVFMQMGKAGGCAASQLESVARLVSLALRSGIEVKSIIEQLRGIRCPSPSWEKGGGRIFSCADAIARVLEIRLSQKSEKEITPESLIFDMETGGNHIGVIGGGVKVGNVIGVCPDCGDALRHEEGCVKCVGCGYSKC